MNMRRSLSLVSGITLWILTEMHSPALAQSEQNISGEFPTITDGLAKRFMIDRPVLVRGLSAESLVLAQYHEREPLVAVVVAETSSYLFVYLEHCDLCAVLTRAHKQSGAVEILHQSHELTCSMLRKDLQTWGVSESICGSF